MMPVLLHFAGRADYHDAWIRLDAHAEQLLQDLGLGRLDFSGRFLPRAEPKLLVLRRGPLW